MKKIFLFIAPLALTSFVLAEPSAFDAGRLDSPNPYGLLQSEKQLLETSSKIKNIGKDVGSIKNQIDNTNVQIEGIHYVFDSINAKIFKIDQSLQALKVSDDNMSATIENLRTELAEINRYIKENRAIESTNQESVKKTLKELTLLIDTINSNYVPKSAFNALEDRVNILSGTPTNDFSSKNSAELVKIGDQHFDKKEYKKAKPYFEELVKRKYKPARGGYILGEIAFHENIYSEAILNYKASAQLYDKASYMPRLMLNTAISFEKLNNKTEAKQFLDALKSLYPDSEEAKYILK